MLESLNQYLFHLTNAQDTAHSSLFFMAYALAEYAIFAVPVVLLAGWLWSGKLTRLAMLQATTSALLALLMAQGVGWIWPHPRPFMMGVGHTLIAHVADPSLPSDHLTLIWSVAFSLLLHRQTRRAGGALALLGLPVAWSRIWLGVHFPLDMVGAAAVSVLSVWACGRWSQRLVQFSYCLTLPWYQRVFAPLIRRGWVFP